MVPARLTPPAFPPDARLSSRGTAAALPGSGGKEFRMPLKLKPLADQVMVITGASSGIGLVTARAAAAQGAKVVLVARSEQALREAAEQITRAGGTADAVAADVTDAKSVEAAAAFAIQRFGRIDSWVNDAGVAIYCKLVETPLDEHEAMMRTNYFGAVNGAQVAWELMRESGGALITVGSIAGEMTSPMLGGYVATKHAVKGFVDSLRIELMEAGAPIQVTLIAPAGVNTPINMHAANHTDAEGLAPQPVYDVAETVKAILDACVNRRRHVTVGGLGRFAVLFAAHFPRAFARLAPASEPMMRTRAFPKSEGDNLAAPRGPHRERSGEQAAIPVSAYNIAGRHPIATVSLVGGAAALALIWARRGTRSTPAGS
jgi:short-subunit dehydrogenase